MQIFPAAMSALDLKRAQQMSETLGKKNPRQLTMFWQPLLHYLLMSREERVSKLARVASLVLSEELIKCSGLH